MAMNRTDTGKFIISLTERIQGENPTASAKDIYTKVFSACSPLIINGDLDSQAWVDMAEYLFPEIAGKTKVTTDYQETIKELESEIRCLKSRLRTAIEKADKAEKALSDEKAKNKKPAPLYSGYSVSSDPCGRSSCRSGGC